MYIYPLVAPMKCIVQAAVVVNLQSLQSSNYGLPTAHYLAMPKCTRFCRASVYVFVTLASQFMASDYTANENDWASIPKAQPARERALVPRLHSKILCPIDEESRSI